VSSGLAQFGCETSVVDDANVGLQTATGNPPDLILLAIELPRMNGFSVCNRLKRDAALKDVPLLILSSDSTDETFEQHRRLRTRADDYIHKPIAVAALIERIRALGVLGDAAVQVSAPPGEILLDEAVVMDEQVPSPDAEVTEFADQAFDALLVPSVSPPVAASQPPVSEPAVVSESDILPVVSLPSAPSAPPPPPPATAAEVEELVRARGRLAELEREHAGTQRKIAELESEARRVANQREELDNLERELEETRQKLREASSGKGVGSAREFLDLRETLNKKDKDLLDLRDQLTRKDKELLGLRDANLVVDRERADLNDRLLELEKQVFELSKAGEAAQADKEQATKRAEDYRRKFERSAADLEERTKAMVTLRDAHDAELGRLRSESQQALDRLQAEQRELVAKARAEAEQAAETGKAQAVEQARAEAAAARDRQLADREAELRHEFDLKLSGLRRAQEDALGKLKAEHEQAMQESGATKRALENELDRNRAEIAQLRRDKERGESTRDARIAGLEQELAERTGERDAAHHAGEEQARNVAGLETDLKERTGERDAAQQALEERDQKIAGLESELARARQETSDVRRELEQESARLGRARSKWAEDRASLERAKDALAAALSRIEEPEGRPLE
jgi:CheY-like chemotaxis protein